MKRIYVAIILPCVAGFSLAHDAMPIPVETAVKEAEIVATARIIKIEVNKSRCETNTKVYMSPEKFLKGSLDKKEIVQSYTHYYWKQAFWPWQEDCPSVHYTYPPVAEGMKEGMKVIFTARYFPDWKDHFATATLLMDRLEEVESLLKK